MRVWGLGFIGQGFRDLGFGFGIEGLEGRAQHDAFEGGEDTSGSHALEVEGLGPGSGVQGAGCRVQGAGCRMQGAGCMVQGAGCRVQGAG